MLRLKPNDQLFWEKRLKIDSSIRKKLEANLLAQKIDLIRIPLNILFAAFIVHGGTVFIKENAVQILKFTAILGFILTTGFATMFPLEVLKKIDDRFIVWTKTLREYQKHSFLDMYLLSNRSPMFVKYGIIFKGAFYAILTSWIFVFILTSSPIGPNLESDSQLNWIGKVLILPAHVLLVNPRNAIIILLIHSLIFFIIPAPSFKKELKSLNKLKDLYYSRMYTSLLILPLVLTTELFSWINILSSEDYELLQAFLLPELVLMAFCTILLLQTNLGLILHFNNSLNSLKGGIQISKKQRWLIEYLIVYPIFFISNLFLFIIPAVVYFIFFSLFNAFLITCKYTFKIPSALRFAGFCISLLILIINLFI